MDKQNLIDGLVDDLQPSGRVMGVGPSVALWLGASWAFVVGAMLMDGPFRPGFAGQLAESPRFLLECLLGLSAGAIAIAAALQHSIPGLTRFDRLLLPAIAVGAAWFGAHVYSLYSPALEPSMLGKREGCSYEVLLLSTGPLALGFWLLRRRFAIHRAATGALAGLAAAAIPALLMQVACMYDPAHILSAHLAPTLFVGALGAAAGAWLLPRL